MISPKKGYSTPLGGRNPAPVTGLNRLTHHIQCFIHAFSVFFRGVGFNIWVYPLNNPDLMQLFPFLEGQELQLVTRPGTWWLLLCCLLQTLGAVHQAWHPKLQAAWHWQSVNCGAIDIFSWAYKSCIDVNVSFLESITRVASTFKQVDAKSELATSSFTKWLLRRCPWRISTAKAVKCRDWADLGENHPAIFTIPS